MDQLIGLREKITGKSHDLHGKIYGFRLRCSLFCQPIEWRPWERIMVNLDVYFWVSRRIRDAMRYHAPITLTMRILFCAVGCIPLAYRIP